MPRRIRRLVLSAAALGVAVALGVVALPAPAALAAAKVTTISTAYHDPVQVALGGTTVLVAQGNGLFRVGSSTAVAIGPRGGDIHGVAFLQMGHHVVFDARAGPQVQHIGSYGAAGERCGLTRGCAGGDQGGWGHSKSYTGGEVGKKISPLLSFTVTFVVCGIMYVVLKYFSCLR